MPRTTIAVAMSLLVLLGACTRIRESAPQRTATEQLLISAAADRAAQRLAEGIPGDTAVYLDAMNFEATDGKYAIATIRDSLLRRGARLVADRDTADMVVEVRSGALSIDDSSSLIGIPSIDVPIPLTGSVGLPEIALFKRERKQGVAKFAATGYDAKTGKLMASSGPEYGLSQKTEYVALLFFSWSTNDVKPPVEGNLVERLSQ